MDTSVKVGEWLQGAFQYVFQEKVLSLYKEMMQFLSAFIVDDSSLERFSFVQQLTNYMAAIVNAVLILIILWYALKKMFFYAGFEVDNPLMFFSKLIFYGILANFGFYLTKYIILFFSSVVSVVASFQPSSNYSDVKTIISSFIPQYPVQLFSAEGIFLLITMFFIIKLCFAFSARFLLIVLVMTPLSPIAIISNMSQAMSGIFKGWLKLLMTLMVSQLAQMLLLVGIVSIRASAGSGLPQLQADFYTLCGVWLMTRVDTYVRDVITGVGIYHNFSSGMAGIKNTIYSMQQTRGIIVKK